MTDKCARKLVFFDEIVSEIDWTRATAPGGGPPEGWDNLRTHTHTR